MKFLPRPATLALIFAATVAAVFLVWVNRERQARVEHVTGLGATGMTPDPSTATGWSGNRRWLIASEHNNDSYQWIMETQQMLASGDWRLRRVAYDNGKESREVSTPSPYRWWFGAVARARHALTGDSLPLAVERAALVVDPVLLGVVLLGGLLLVAWQLGAWPATAWVLGGVFLYPFSAAYIPGAPDSLGLSLAFAVASVLLAGIAQLTNAPTSRRTLWMAAAGAAGGLGLWVDFFVQGPVLLGLGLGAVLGALTQGNPADTPQTRDWRVWASGGAILSLLAYALEFPPGPFSWEIKGNHPLVALAWLALGEIIARIAAGRGTSVRPGLRHRVVLPLAVLVLAGFAFLLWKADLPWSQGRDVFGTRLTNLPQAPVAESFRAWLGQEGPKLHLLGVVLPLGLLVVPLALWLRKAATAAERTALALPVMALLVALPFAWLQLRGWALVSGLLLVSGVIVTAILSRQPTRIALAGWGAAAALLLLPGIFCQRPTPRAEYAEKLTSFEVEGIVERSLAHWLADRFGHPPVVLAPPFRTTALSFHGNFQALGSLNLKNKDALGAAARIASATTPEEAKALMERRGVTHVVMPSWDSYLEEYARLFTSRPENSFVFALKQWAMPPWLLPVPYQLPTVGGFENQTAFLFEVTEEQDAATTLSRLAEYFLEMGQEPLAASAERGLAGYPENLPALAALAQIQMARGDAANAATTLRTLLAVYGATEEHDLAWDRRVSLAVVLMQGKQAPLARRELEICLNLLDESRLRSLSVGSLYRFQILLKAFGLKIEDARLRELGVVLLPPGLRAAIQ